MNTNSIYAKLAIILPDSDLERIKIASINNLIIIRLDVHKLKCYQARRLINNIITLVNTAFELIVIHGFNHGTAIRDMLSTNFDNTHISKKYIDSNNEGVTHMLVLI